MSQLVGRLSFRVQQLNVKVETKTMDNVFLVAVVSVQYQILRDKVFEAFYALTNPAQQITAHVYDVMRSQLPTLELDAVFEAKEELALAVKNALADTMTGYGYQIVQVLITDLDPDQRVKVRVCVCVCVCASVFVWRLAFGWCECWCEKPYVYGCLQEYGWAAGVGVPTSRCTHPS